MRLSDCDAAESYMTVILHRYMLVMRQSPPLILLRASTPIFRLPSPLPYFQDWPSIPGCPSQKGFGLMCG